MSRKGCPNKTPKLQYPRKCEHCEYVSNNPSMYHYHKKTHEQIPKGTLCDHGCGNPALYRKTNGVNSCSRVSQHCPAYLEKHSDRVKEQWKGADDRRERTREDIIRRLNTEENYDRIRKTLKEKWGDFTPEQAKEYRRYAKRIRGRAQKWAKDQGYTLGQQTWHVDHKFSIWDSWHANLPESIVNHPANLQVIGAKVNSGKGAKSSITLEELLAVTGHMNLLVEQGK